MADKLAILRLGGKDAAENIEPTPHKHKHTPNRVKYFKTLNLSWKEWIEQRQNNYERNNIYFCFLGVCVLGLVNMNLI